PSLPRQSQKLDISLRAIEITQHQTKICYITKHTSVAVPQVWSRITSSEDFCWAIPPQKSMK
ncbi:7079_t:CDS:2, partial [Dentiscutata erythropus]